MNTTTNNDYARVAEVELRYTPKRCTRPTITTSNEASQVFLANWDEGQIEFQESFRVMLLNRAHRCMGICTIAQGGGTQCAVDMRNVLQSALVGNAYAIILCHNHPSGYIMPSAYDNDITTKIKRGCEAVGIKLFDHIIITPGGEDYYSYAEDGKL